MDDEQRIELPLVVNTPKVFGNVDTIETDDVTSDATGYVGDRALAFRHPDDGAQINTVISTVVPLDVGHMVWLTDEYGNGLYGSGVWAPDEDDD